ncbi:methyltransferase domain-containing protein [Nocardia jejuensis]|uniref:methyltransferase domain-containing protein n=1 Tax=Nocardia jejuensis TaxID=328049 RepID=UPI000831A41B|nr:methyltransferase domain-containing protein [Nocardia jejuensis]
MSEQNPIPSFHVDRVHDTDNELITRVLDLQAEVAGVVRMREWVRDALAVREGDTALDIGSGTGSEVLALARLVGGTGRAVGVDPNPAMLALARERAREFTEAPVDFIEGSAYALPLPDADIDVIRCERVYQHLDDPAQATAEIARVLRPGGRVALIDSDWSTAITHPGDPELIERLHQQMQSASPNRTSGRRLRGLLHSAGLVIDDIGSEALVWEPESIMPMYTAGTERVVAAGLLTEAQREQLLGEMSRGIERGDYHFSVTMFAVVAHKP